VANDRGHPHVTDLCQFRGHDAFGDVTCHRGRRAIDLTRILAGKCPTTMASNTAVRIDDDLPTRQPGIGFGPSDPEGVSRIDKNDRTVPSVSLTAHHMMRQYAVRDDRFHDGLDQLVAQIAQRQARHMMRRDRQVGDGYRRIVFVPYRHLGFAVRIEALHDPLLTRRGQRPSELMREPDIGDFLGRQCVLEEHGTGEITTWLKPSSQVFSLL